MSKRSQRAAKAEPTSPWVIGGLIGIAILVVAVLIISTQNQRPAAPTGAPDLSSLTDIPTGVTAEGVPYRGSLDAKVVVQEYEDLRCPFCQKYFLETEAQVLEQYVKTGLVRIESHVFPLLGNPSVAATEALECAKEQGKYWEFRHIAFTYQPSEATPDGRDEFVQYAKWAGADSDKFASCFDTQRYRTTVQRAGQAAQAANVTSTPTFIVNGVTYTGAYAFTGDSTREGFKDILDAALLAANQP